ncbi:beta-defensin 7-like [Pantherophis guttatus]|uniref:Beta-defensin 7-like n=1 Tax=Pantherophis guttatus TaxID=94885 RepID=A0A6P9BZG9_PANGU|nr:beta-defensin 7-like [Pantherophis guttatus]
MKIPHFLLAGLFVLLLVSGGFASNKPKSRRECYLQNGTCKLWCSYPLRRYGRCGFLRKCCISPQFPQGNRITAS